MNKTLQIVGPYFTNFSYARMNRGLALALEKIQNNYSISLWCSSDQIDYMPTESELKKYPKLWQLVNRKKVETDVAIYDNFPKSLTSLHGLKDLPGRTRLFYLAWEESIYPKTWVDEINQNLHGVMVISEFVRKILKDSGVKIPIEVIHCGLDEKVRIHATAKYPLTTSKTFKFLHISTAKVRKGVDVLLKAYFAEFSKKDDVTLVIKASPGPDNVVDELLNQLKNENSPEVIYINRSDLSDEEIRNLHYSCDCEVYPSRAEGFGLPVAEAMWHDKPVIATNYSAYLDFADTNSAYLVDYKLEFTNESEMVNLGAKWAEPDVNHLKKLMRHVYENKDSKEVQSKVALAKKRVENLTWENAAKNTIKFIEKIEKIKNFKEEDLAVISTLNSQCGIAEYSEKLYRPIESSFESLTYLANKDIADRVRPDESNIIRTWEFGETNFDTTVNYIKNNGINHVHIQYHSGSHYPPQSLDIFIKKLKDLDKKIYLTFHAVRGKGFDYINELKNLNIVDKIFIHNKEDMLYATQKLSNVVLLNLPTMTFKRREKRKIRESLGINNSYPIILTHGLMNINKSIPNIIKAINELKKEYPDILFLSVNAVSSNNSFSTSILKECQQLVKSLALENHVRFFTDFLDDDTVSIFLQSSDVNVLAYQDVGESSSAAVRKFLASLNPTIVTDIKMFAELNKEVFKIKDNSVESIVEGVRKVLTNKTLAEGIVKSSKEYIENNSYDRKALEMIENYV
jgi:glycosyltransferase involved in cell wall biosynthesis